MIILRQLIRDAMPLFPVCLALQVTLSAAEVSTDREESAGNFRPALSIKRLNGRVAGQESQNSIGMILCWCPAGKFVMGSSLDASYHEFDEGPVNVNLSRGFWIGKFEVTEKQNLTVTRRKPKVSVGPEHPMTSVKGGDVRRFCETLTKQERDAGIIPEDWAYGLPTEAQWEYACRAGSQTAWSFADNPGQLAEYGNFADATLFARDDSRYRYADRKQKDGFATTAPVGQFQPNAWGIHDMHGNVWEWCSDKYEENLSGGIDPKGPDKGERGQVLRGGSWISLASYCRSAHRHSAVEVQEMPYVGFRVVLSCQD